MSYVMNCDDNFAQNKTIKRVYMIDNKATFFENHLYQINTIECLFLNIRFHRIFPIKKINKINNFVEKQKIMNCLINKGKKYDSFQS